VRHQKLFRHLVGFALSLTLTVAASPVWAWGEDACVWPDRGPEATREAPQRANVAHALRNDLRAIPPLRRTI